MFVFLVIHPPLQWRHDGHDGVSNHEPHDCLLNRLFGRGSKKTSKLRITGLCMGISPGTGEFPAQMASNAENVSIWWRHHDNERIALIQILPRGIRIRLSHIVKAAVLPMRLSNFKAIWWFELPISRLRVFTRSYDKTSYQILKCGPGRQQPWYWTSSPEILPHQHRKYYLTLQKLACKLHVKGNMTMSLLLQLRHILLK